MELEDNIRSEELQDIMGKVPSWIVRFGSTLILLVMIILIVLSFTIKYPDILTGTITISTKTPPINLISKAEGRINLFVRDGDSIKRDQFLSIIESSANTKDIFMLRDTLNYFQIISQSPIILLNDSLKKFPSMNLGELQDYYNSFKRYCTEYFILLELKQKENSIQSYKKQIDFLSSQALILKKKKNNLEQEFAISQRQYRIDSLLYYKDKAITRIDLDKSEQSYLAFLNTLEEYNEAELTNANEISKLTFQIKEAFIISIDERSKLETAIKHAYKDLETKFAIWKEKYVLTSPIDGKISFYQFWNNNQFVRFGEEVANVIPSSNGLLGSLRVPADRFGKARSGQRVRIHLDNYPASEYGMVNGYVTSITEFNRNNIYVVSIMLPNGLRTNYNKELEFKQNLNGIGEIITEDLSIMERIFYQFRALFVTKK